MGGDRVLLPIAIAVIAILQVICLLALVDQYKGLLQIRESMGLLDTPEPIQLAALTAAPAPSELGLPERLDAEERVVVAFLSTKCTTCRNIGKGLRGHIPTNMLVMLEGPRQDACEQWLTEVGLSGERVLIESMHDGVASRLDLSIFPSALIFEAGSLRAAQTLPSTRQLRQLLIEAPSSTVSDHDADKELRHAG
jgi:hypothetical protein